ncbi:hypothetical protein H8D91_00930 [archaeon]|nr:hypothetical protein [archaeon]
MEQLLEETYEMFDSIFKTELDLANDISPFTGWNMMYDSEQERFRLFDSDTVSESTESYHVKMFHFFENVARTATSPYQEKSEEITEGLSYLMNRFFQENPQLIDAETENSHKYCDDGQKLNPKVVELVQESDTEGLLDYLKGKESYPVKIIDKNYGPVIRVDQFVERHAVTIPVKPRAKPYGFFKENGKSIQIDTKEEYDKLLEEIVHTT